MNTLEEVEFLAVPAKWMRMSACRCGVWMMNCKPVSVRLGKIRIAFDPLNKRTVSAGFRETDLNNVHLRVLNIPLLHNNKRVAVMQIATVWIRLLRRAPICFLCWWWSGSMGSLLRGRFVVHAGAGAGTIKVHCGDS